MAETPTLTIPVQFVIVNRDQFRQEIAAVLEDLGVAGAQARAASGDDEPIGSAYLGDGVAVDDAEVKPRRKRRTKAEIEADRRTQETATPQPPPVPATPDQIDDGEPSPTDDDEDWQPPWASQ
jgi:hypothetical protein